jgi:glucose/mannose transport system permease protein
MYCPKKEIQKGLAVVIPFAILLFIFVYGFIGWSFKVSLSAWDGVIPNMKKVGFSNYVELFHSRRFNMDLWNTLFFTILFMMICVVGGFILAYLLYSGLKAEGLFRTIYMYPLSISFIVSGVIWKWILTPSEGINKLFQMMGFNATFGWYTSTGHIGHYHVALISLVIAASWQYLGYTMAMFLAGLRGIPTQIVESAMIDGAGEFRIIRNVLLPQLKPITFSALIVLGHISLKIFDLVYAMTGAGPKFVTDFPGLYMFETTFRGNHYAEGAAISIIMLLLVALVVVPYLVSTFRKED